MSLGKLARIFGGRLFIGYPLGAVHRRPGANLQCERQVNGILGRGARAFVITLAVPDFLKPEALVEPERDCIAGGYLEVQPARFRLSGCPAEGLDQPPPDAPALPGLAYPERENFRIVRRQPAKDEAGGFGRLADPCGESDGAWMIEQKLEAGHVPSRGKERRVQPGQFLGAVCSHPQDADVLDGSGLRHEITRGTDLSACGLASGCLR